MASLISRMERSISSSSKSSSVAWPKSVGSKVEAKDTGADQQMGPLNPYERRLVHMAVTEVPGVSTQSLGDSFTKTVIISARRS